MPDDRSIVEGGALTFQPVTPERLADLDRFSRAHGKFRYCSCARWRLTSSAYKRSTKDTRVGYLEGLARGGTPIGLAYLADEPVGWCSIAPRETYAALERFRALRPPDRGLDTEPVWAVVCFFVDRRVRRAGVTLGLLRAAVAYAAAAGARIIEGYPVEPGALYTYMGSPATFRRVGFRDATPPGQARQVMRLVVTKPRSPRRRAEALR